MDGGSEALGEMSVEQLRAYQQQLDKFRHICDQWGVPLKAHLKVQRPRALQEDLFPGGVQGDGAIGIVDRLELLPGGSHPLAIPKVIAKQVVVTPVIEEAIVISEQVVVVHRPE